VPDGHAVVYRRLRVVDPAIERDLELHRKALRDDYRFWGEAVAAEIGDALARAPAAAQTLAEGGVVTLPLAPVLLVLAASSDAVRSRCLEFVDAQRSLMASVCAELSGARALVLANDRVARALATMRTPRSGLPEPERIALEAWLDVRARTPRAVANG